MKEEWELVLDNGALFRSNARGKIRKAIIEEDIIECVIQLSSNLFYNTTSAGCIIIFNRKKTPNMRNKIFFINAENEVEIGKAQSYLRANHIEKITNAYNEKSSVAKFSELVDLSVIKGEDNEYNLNVSRYVDTLPEEEIIDIESIQNRIKDVIEKRNNLEEVLFQNLGGLGYGR